MMTTAQDADHQMTKKRRKKNAIVTSLALLLLFTSTNFSTVVVRAKKVNGKIGQFCEECAFAFRLEDNRRHHDIIIHNTEDF